jgi:hypothetical protein
MEEKPLYNKQAAQPPTPTLSSVNRLPIPVSQQFETCVHTVCSKKTFLLDEANPLEIPQLTTVTPGWTTLSTTAVKCKVMSIYLQEISAHVSSTTPVLHLLQFHIPAYRASVSLLVLRHSHVRNLGSDTTSLRKWFPKFRSWWRVRSKRLEPLTKRQSDTF